MAMQLVQNDVMDEEDRGLFEEINEWFAENLPWPPQCKRQEKVVCFFKTENAKEMMQWMRPVLWLLERYHHPYYVVYTNSPGEIVYEDKYQVAVKVQGDHAMALMRFAKPDFLLAAVLICILPEETEESMSLVAVLNNSVAAALSPASMAALSFFIAVLTSLLALLLRAFFFWLTITRFLADLILGTLITPFGILRDNDALSFLLWYSLFLRDFLFLHHHLWQP